MEVIIINPDEREEALRLVEKTFMEYEAPDYLESGIETFNNSVFKNEEYLNSIVIYGAFEEKKTKQIKKLRLQPKRNLFHNGLY